MILHFTVFRVIDPRLRKELHKTVCILSSFTFVWQDVFPTGLQTFPESFSSWPDLTDWPLLDRKMDTYSQVGWEVAVLFLANFR